MIDYDKIAVGFIDCLDRNESACLSFGMIPHEKFKLLTVEISPSISYKITDTLAIAGGLRAVYSEGEVRSDGSDIGLPFKRGNERKCCNRRIQFGTSLETDARLGVWSDIPLKS